MLRHPAWNGGGEVEMLLSLLLSSSGRAELSRNELGSGRAFKFKPRVRLGRVGLASFMYCKKRQPKKIAELGLSIGA